MSVGATLALLPRFDPEKALRMIAAERVTIFEGVLTMYVALLAAADRSDIDVSSLLVCVSGGAAMPVEVLRAFEDRFGCTVLEGYRLSETSPAVCFNHPGRVRKVGSIATPIDGVQMRIVDEDDNNVPVGSPGEIQVRGHNVMEGYWNLPDGTEAAIKDSWFSTGDIGRVDEDGYCYIVDRKKDASAEPEELCRFVKSRVAAYKYPRRIWFVDSLPTGPTGKVLRRKVQPLPLAEG